MGLAVLSFSASGAYTGPLVTDEALNALTDPAAIRDHLIRIPSLIDSDPRAAVGNAKDLLESTAKIVLRELDQPYDAKPKLPALFDATHTALRTHAKEFRDSAAICNLLGGWPQQSRVSRNSATKRARAMDARVCRSGLHRVTPAWPGATTVWVQFALETLAERKRTNAADGS